MKAVDPQIFDSIQSRTNSGFLPAVDWDSAVVPLVYFSMTLLKMEPMPNEAASFVFMTCTLGAERALKLEVARTEPAWRLAFSRPGFLTFKIADERQIDVRQLAERHWALAHAHGVSVGNVIGQHLAALARELWQLEGIARLLESGSFTDVHVWRPVDSSAEDLNRGTTRAGSPLGEEIENAVRSAAPNTCDKLRRMPADSRRPTARGGLVLDVVLLQPGEWWIGYHHALSWPARWPGGAIPVVLPDHAVSRAYAKMEEAIQWSGIPLAAGDECVEVGCAPGGASQALLDRRLFVTGIDPAEVDPAVVAHPRFRHLKKRGKEVRRAEFLGVRWLVADMNIAPEATLDEVEAIVTHPNVTIRGMVLTLKFSDWSRAELLPEITKRVHDWGYRDVRVRQLVTGGQEVCLVALRRKALRRLGRRAGRQQQLRNEKRRNAPPAPSSGSHSDL
jgi:23S rRNA (cytidine2498-2'-O)-methyltransferase